MRLFRTLRTHRPTFLADGSIDLYAPTEWRKMTQQQLRYVLTLLSLFDDTTVVKTYMLVRLSGIHIEGETIRVAHDQPKGYRCWFRPAWWKPRRWFTLEAWQVQGMISQFDFIDPFDGMDVRLERIHGCRAVDDILDHYPFGDYLLAEQWPFFFRKVDAGIEEMDIDLMGAMDAQIRALTEGDITKEETIKRLPCWRALTELNQKAREAKEFHDKYDKK